MMLLPVALLLLRIGLHCRKVLSGTNHYGRTMCHNREYSVEGFRWYEPGKQSLNSGRASGSGTQTGTNRVRIAIGGGVKSIRQHSSE